MVLMQFINEKHFPREREKRKLWLFQTIPYHLSLLPPSLLSSVDKSGVNVYLCLVPACCSTTTAPPLLIMLELNLMVSLCTNCGLRKFSWKLMFVYNWHNVCLYLNITIHVFGDMEGMTIRALPALIKIS